MAALKPRRSLVAEQRNTVVFLGPSLPLTRARELLDAEYRPPARMGSVYRAVRDGFRTVALVDGYYESVPAVWHKEICWALSSGTAVYGASSMGALRAAELRTLGMVGVGQVFAQYVSGELTDDDEVALLHAPARAEYRPVSVPMVTLRARIAAAVDEGLLPDTVAAEAVSQLKSRHYPDRTHELLVRLVADRLEPHRLERFERWLPTCDQDPKRDDAVCLLRLLASRTGSAALASHPRPFFERTWIWDHLVDSVSREVAPGPHGSADEAS